MYFDLNLLLDTIKDLARENPDFIYSGGTNGCYYTQNCLGQSGIDQGCIVGRAINRIYPDLLDKLVIFDDGSPLIEDTGFYNLFSHLTMLKEEDLSDQNISIMEQIGNIQLKQDLGTPWGKCINE